METKGINDNNLPEQEEKAIDIDPREEGAAASSESGEKTPEEVPDGTEAVKPADPEKIKQSAKDKLEKELKYAADKTFAEPVIGYLLKRCAEDAGLSEDVIQEHKTWKKCFDYIFEHAKKQSKGRSCAVRDDVVYEWAEDYYHIDDKALEEKKAKEKAERREKAQKAKKAAKTRDVEKKEKKAEPVIAKPEKPKRNGKDMEGQMDLFSMLGM